MNSETVKERILRRKEEMGSRVLILGHHYQRQEVIQFADFRGDSFELCRRAAQHTESTHIVFCGVHFMAESADILAGPGQVVQHPDLRAGCPLASMAGIDEVTYAWTEVESATGTGTVIPLTYMNSEAALKAFCGRHGGAVCTSSNAARTFKWALSQRKILFFFPDENLGKNTARAVGISDDEVFVWDPQAPPDRASLIEALRNVRVILWKGFCHVHTYFTVDHILTARMSSPEAKIVVHPECREEVVSLADAYGSTEFICRYVRDAPQGSMIYVGTEINLVDRLARENPGKKVFELARSLCPNMFRIDPAKLLWTLDHLGEANIVRVDPEIKGDARLALDRMLALP